MGSRKELRTLASCLWVGEPSSQRENSYSHDRIVVWAGRPLLHSDGPIGHVFPSMDLRVTNVSWAFPHGHFLTEEVRVNIKPSELSSRLPHPGLSCQRPLVGGLHSAGSLPGLSTNRPGKERVVLCRAPGPGAVPLDAMRNFSLPPPSPV